MYPIYEHLTTYSPSQFEEHDDTTDFESCVPIEVNTKPGYHRLKRPIVANFTKNQNFCCNLAMKFEYPAKLESINKNCQVSSTFIITEKVQKPQLNRVDQLRDNQSKLCIFRQKVIPCLSTIFKRPFTSYTPIEQPIKNTRDSSCQHEKKRKKKLQERPDAYDVRPVYAIQGNIHHLPKPYNPPKALTYNSNSKNIKNSSTSTDSETFINKKRIKEQKNRKRFRAEMMKEQIKYQQILKHQNQRPSKGHKLINHVYNQSQTSMSSKSPFLKDIPSAGFWDYFFDKINRKYHVHKPEVSSKKCSSGSDTCNDPPCTTKRYDNLGTPQDDSCCWKDQGTCLSREPSNTSKLSDASKTSNTSETSKTSKTSNTSKGSNARKANSKKSLQEKNLCKCRPIKKLLAEKSVQFPIPVDENSCHEDHDEIIKTLNQKYNGEILCIHNPPCILINGCLNLPSTKEDPPQTSFWPIIFKTKPNLYKKKGKAPILKSEKTCQYGATCIDVQKCEVPGLREEKRVQSACAHDPPCEVVRCCVKEKYNPSLQTPCIHVPMCKKYPACIINAWPNTTNKICEHKPKCLEVPICKTDTRQFQKQHSFGTQVQPNASLVCHHNPPCIMTPKCLGVSALKDFIHYEAVADCQHSPACELVPVCCRKINREMVAASSQYPNSCRMV